MNPIRSIAAASLLLVALAGCASSATTPPPVATASQHDVPPSASAADPQPGALSITERDFRFDPPDVTVDAGAVSLAVTNAGPTVHDLTIRDSAGTILGETADLKPDASETLTVNLPAGSFTIFCSLPGHESLGLKGTLTVR